MNLKFYAGLSLVAAALLPLADVRATGFRLPDQDAFATARGEAFVATADNASAVYYNPAGISQLEGGNFRGGIYGIYLDPNYKSPAGTTFHPTGNQFDAVPQLFYTYKPQDSLFSFGIGAFAPFGLNMEWPQDTGFRTVGFSGAITYYTINPVVAFQALPNLSIGAGLTVNYAELDLKQGLFWPAQHFDEFRFKGDGWNAGYNLGMLWKLHEKVSVGMSFRSSTTIGLQGHTEYYNKDPLPLPGGGLIPAFPAQRVGANARLPFPLNAIFGVSYRPTSDWNFEFDADYTDWGALGNLSIKQDHGFDGLIPQNIPYPLDWQPSWYYEFGATRYLSGGWSVSAGYIFNENSVPDAHYNPVVADLDRHFLSLGTGYKGAHFNFDVAYQFGYGPTRTVSGSAPSAAGQTADGKYEFFSQAVLLTVGWHF